MANVYLPVKTVSAGVATFNYSSRGTFPCRVDYMHRSDPSDALTVWDSGDIPDRHATVFFASDVATVIQPGMYIRIVDGPYKGDILEVEFNPTVTFGIGPSGRTFH